MEENPKKGARDISDLKARLGLKKGSTGVMPAVTPTPIGVPSVPAAGGAPQQRTALPSPFGPAPTPARIQAPLPAPPGFRHAEPELPPAPPPPDPRRDPFASQQPMMHVPPASYYGYQPLPGTDDGQPAAQISKPKPWGRIGGAAGVALVLFIAGNACGRIYESRVNFNKTTDQASDIQVEVEKMGKTLTIVAEKMASSPEFAARNNPDVDLAVDLGSLELDKKKPDTQKIFHTNYMYLEDLAIDRLFTYYNDTILLYNLITVNARKSEADREAIQNYAKSGATRGDKNYGVVLDQTGQLVLANFVEVGAPVCPKEGQADCSATELKGFKYRTDLGGSWSQRPVHGKPGEILIPIQKSPLFNTVASGSPDVLAARDHMRRMIDIRGLTQKLAAEQKELLTDLKHASDRAKVFTF